jgi:hypothetical protein
MSWIIKNRPPCTLCTHRTSSVFRVNRVRAGVLYVYVLWYEAAV